MAVSLGGKRMSTKVQSSAPGCLMILGEYAVLESSAAVMMTLRQRLYVEIQYAEALKISSDRFGLYEEGQQQQPLPHVLLIKKIIQAFQNTYNLDPSFSFLIEIRSDIHPLLGFGSSAALIAAILKALSAFYETGSCYRTLFTIGLSCVHQIYRYGSGADLLAALFDHPFCVVRPQEKSASPLMLQFFIGALYVGYKTPTPQVIDRVKKNISSKQWDTLIFSMTALVEVFLKTQDFSLLKEYQGYLEALGVCCPLSQEALRLLKAEGRYSKISGSGLGDCVISFSCDPSDRICPSLLEQAPEQFLYFPSCDLVR
jgi:mevalonate kinase